jgi:hypothetical protein
MVVSVAIAIIVLAALNVYQFWAYDRRERMLLDRLMARDFGEYQAITIKQEGKKPRRFSMTDVQMAELESSRKVPAHG